MKPHRLIALLTLAAFLLGTLFTAPALAQVGKLDQLLDNAIETLKGGGDCPGGNCGASGASAGSSLFSGGDSLKSLFSGIFDMFKSLFSGIAGIFGGGGSSGGSSAGGGCPGGNSGGDSGVIGGGSASGDGGGEETEAAADKPADAPAASGGGMGPKIQGEARKQLGTKKYATAATSYGTLACAAYVSGVLKASGAMKGSGSLNTVGLRKILEGQGWKKVTVATAKPGDVVFWGPYPGGKHGHVGVIDGKVGGTQYTCDNSSKKRVPVRRPLDTKRKILCVLRHPQAS